MGTVTREPLTTSERKMMFQEVGAAFFGFYIANFPPPPLQRLRQVASRKREPSAFEKVRTALLEDLLPCLR